MQKNHQYSSVVSSQSTSLEVHSCIKRTLFLSHISRFGYIQCQVIIKIVKSISNDFVNCHFLEDISRSRFLHRLTDGSRPCISPLGNSKPSRMMMMIQVHNYAIIRIQWLTSIPIQFLKRENYQEEENCILLPLQRLLSRAIIIA